LARREDLGRRRCGAVRRGAARPPGRGRDVAAGSAAVRAARAGDRAAMTGGKLLALRPPRGDASEMSDEALIAACATGDAAAMGGRGELVTRCGVAMAELPHHLREAFVLCDVEDMSGRDAAAALGVREGTVWRRVHEARRAVREALGDHGGRS